MNGKNASYFSFDPLKTGNVPIITAYGTTQTFGYHAAKTTFSVEFTSDTQQSCLCITGKKDYIGQNGLLPFSKNCREEPFGDLTRQHNPTCTLEQYAGVLSCCHHQNILLDKDQNPWPTQIDEYHMKFRFWYQDYTPVSGTVPASHKNLPRFYYQTEAWAGEYDIVKCPKETPAHDCIQEITAHWQAHEMGYGASSKVNMSEIAGI